MESGFRSRSGISVEDIAAVSRDLFCRLLGAEPSDRPGAMDRWTSAVEYLVDVCARQDEAKWSDLASGVCRRLLPKLKWDEQPPAVRLLWEAVTRHAVNCVMAEDRSEFEAARSQEWDDWIVNRLNEAKQKELNNGQAV